MKEKTYTIICTVGSLATIFGFFGITPEIIGDCLYRIWHVVSPILCLILGIFTGWNARKWYLSRSKTLDFKNQSTKPTESCTTKYENPSTDLILKMSRPVAASVYKAFKNGEFIPLEKIDSVAIFSIGSKDGLFEFKQLYFLGQPGQIKNYGLKKEWMIFLSDQTNLDQLKAAAGTFLSERDY